MVGSLSEKSFVTINGSRQGLFIKARDACNPVLLYFHGGIPDPFLTRPIFEEPARTRQILREDVLRGLSTLADDDRGIRTGPTAGPSRQSPP